MHNVHVYKMLHDKDAERLHETSDLESLRINYLGMPNSSVQFDNKQNSSLYNS